MASAKFSTSALLADLSSTTTTTSTKMNSTHCIKPQLIQNPPPGSVLSPIIPTVSSKTYPNTTTITTTNDNNKMTTRSTARIASVTLSDCLTCSGCITTSEDLLVSNNTLSILKNKLEENNKSVTMVLSQQSVANIAVTFKLKLNECARLLCGALKKKGIRKVLDGAVGMVIALKESLMQVEKNSNKNNSGDNDDDGGGAGVGGPILESMCPAVAIYMEKTQKEEIVGLLSRVRSVQGIMGRMIDDNAFGVAVMPCHDRKLEAARLEGDGIDLVMTTEELVCFIGEDVLRERKVEQMDIDPVIAGVKSSPFGVNVASGSGGFAEYVLRQLGGLNPNLQVEWKDVGRGGLIKEAEANGIKVAKAYGFKAIARVLRLIKANKCHYTYVEAMSCPGGCNNGGGQLKGEGREESNRIFEETENLFTQGHSDPIGLAEQANRIYGELVGSTVGSLQAKKLFHTSFRKRTAKDIEGADLSW